MGVKCGDRMPFSILISASGMLDNSLQKVQTLFMQQLGKFRKGTNRQVLLKELCWATPSTHWCKMVVCYWKQMAKTSSAMMRVVFQDNVRMGCVHNAYLSGCIPVPEMTYTYTQQWAPIPCGSIG